MKLKSIALLFALAAHASAAISFTLPGNTETGSWPTLSSGGPALNTLIPATGSPFYTSSSSGIYSGFGTSASYAISDSSPATDISTLVLQMRSNFEPTSIILTLTGTSGTIANLAASYFASQVTSDATIFDMAWQWDLSGITEDITGYTIAYTHAVHTVTYVTSPLTVTTSDSFAQVIPEPTTSLIGAASLGLLALRRRRA